MILLRTTTRYLTLAAALALVAPSRAVLAQSPARLRLGTMAPQGTSYHRILQEMGERWRTATGGQVQLTIYAGTMGSEAELVRRMRLGQLQLGTLSVIGLEEIDPQVTALSVMPMMFRSAEEAEYVRLRLQPQLEQRLLERGFVVLFWADAGWVQYFTRTAAVRPEEFRRLKVFVTASSTQQVDLMRAEGWTPVPLEWSDALTALQTGMVDAIPTIPYYALAMQFHTVATHMLRLNWAPLAGATVVNRRTWEGLPAETRAAMLAAARDAGQRFQTRAHLENDSAVTAMQRRGLVVHDFTPAAAAEWRTMVERLYPRIRGSLVPADVFDQVVRLLDEYRAQRPASR
jgi:TRAP-type C4-dicarboxylate transport system substrate-binding protein